MRLNENFSFESCLNASRKRIDALTAFLDRQLSSVSCVRHPAVYLELDRELSRKRTSRCGQNTAAYGQCALCEEEQREHEIQHRLGTQGVPLIHRGSTFDNWTPHSPQDKAHHDSCRDFVRVGKGFLLLLGGTGTGKTHLGIAIQRSFQSAYFVEQDTLLENLRSTYNNPKVPSPVKQCQAVKLLVLDDVGFSGGGRDELPMLHRILNHRYLEMLPTVITGNIQPDAIPEVFGERLADRITQCGYKCLIFDGASQRPDRRDAYFGTSHHREV